MNKELRSSTERSGCGTFENNRDLNATAVLIASQRGLYPEEIVRRDSAVFSNTFFFFFLNKPKFELSVHS